MKDHVCSLSILLLLLEYLVVRPLVKQGSRWITSNRESLCRLQVMLEDAEMCSTVASQIISVKCKTRCQICI